MLFCPPFGGNSLNPRAHKSVPTLPDFMSTALYHLWKINESSQILYTLAQYNPFSQAVELIRFALPASDGFRR
jgi:hypothetical protein